MTTERKSYSSNKFQLELPYLIEVQKASYEQFLQASIPQDKRMKVGLERVFQDIFPITDLKELFSLKYEGYYFGIPKYSIPEQSMNTSNLVKHMPEIALQAIGFIELTLRECYWMRRSS